MYQHSLIFDCLDKMSFQGHHLNNFDSNWVPNAIYQVYGHGFQTKRFLKIFTIYGHGSHLDYVIQLICIKNHSHSPISFHTKFGLKIPNNFGENTS